MISLIEYIYERKEDMIAQVVIIMGAPGMGKTYWMHNNAVQFFRKQGIIITPKELDIDNTLKKYQIEAFPDFCKRVLNYKTTAVYDKQGHSVHGKAKAWQEFIDNEQARFNKLNAENGGNEHNVPTLSDIEYEFCAPYITRYDNATDASKPKILDEFKKVMYKEYFERVFASDFSVRAEAKDEYRVNLVKKISNLDTDICVAISGANMKTIDEICQLCKGKTIRLVYLNGNVDKAVIQDAKRPRSGGEKFVRDYAAKTVKNWEKLTDKESPDFYKNKGIDTIYELYDTESNDLQAYTNWKLDKSIS